MFGSDALPQNRGSVGNIVVCWLRSNLRTVNLLLGLTVVLRTKDNHLIKSIHREVKAFKMQHLKRLEKSRFSTI